MMFVINYRTTKYYKIGADDESKQLTVNQLERT